MADWNTRQALHVERVQRTAARMGQLVADCREIVLAHTKEFAAVQDNAIDNEQLIENKHITLGRLNSFVNQAAASMVDFYYGEPVTQRAYGEDAVRVENRSLL